MLVVPDEANFINQYLNELSVRSVRFGEDYTSRQLPKPLKIKRSPLSPSKPSSTDAVPEPIELTVKILKPAAQLTIVGLSVNDTIEDLKEQIHRQKSDVAVNRQRLLLKGKVLSDNKTLSDCGLGDKATVHLMLTAAPKLPETGKFGLTVATEKKLEDPAFWEAIRSTVSGLVVHEQDTNILVSKMQEFTKQ
ncbi:ubiquitin-related domain-containing protein [Fennellomyces sp. T-0311]|nr:ubiquitin-related domain-containing protein [Fennellomyces sp. T-0311]